MKSPTCTLNTFPLPNQRPNVMVLRVYSNIYNLDFQTQSKFNMSMRVFSWWSSYIYENYIQLSLSLPVV